MFDDTTLGPQVLTNPGIVQNLAITEMQNRLGGIYSIADPNNGFNLMLEYGSSVFAQFTRGTENKFEALYPKRATTAQNLYAFMSDYDYVNLTSSPASITLRLVLDSDWVIANAVAYDTNYNKIVIPATSSFMLSARLYGLYYPIQLLVNRVTNAITVLYDTSVANPLQALSSNLLDEVSEFSQGGINLISLVFPVYQFQTTSYTEVLVNTTGFNKTYPYTDRFYAARVYSSTDNGVTWQELAYSLSQTVYDVTVPTVLMTLLEDNQSIQLQIPQIYFTNNLIGRKLQIVFYTTDGALNVAIPQADASAIQVNFDTTSSVYSTCLSQPPVCIIAIYNQTTIVGGSNALTFEQLRTAVVNGTLYDDTPITPLQLIAAAQKAGYMLNKYLDNITQRIYFASATLVTPDSRVVPVAVSGVLLNQSFLTGNPDTILPYDDNTYTILPTTVFKYSPTTNTSQPLTNDEVHWLSGLSPAALATELNTNLYTRQPFHIVLNTSSKYPAAKTYNLLTPETTSLIFVKENVHSAAQLSITNAVITSEDNGTGGFTITMGVKRSAALAGLAAPGNFKLIMLTELNGNTPVTLEATYVTSSNAVDEYSLFLPTTYQISATNFFRTQVTSLGVSILGEMPLQATFDIRLCVLQSLYPTIPQDSDLVLGVDSSYTNSYLVVSQQTMDITFGEDLSNLIFNTVTTTFGPTSYATYPETVYYTNNQDVYLKSGTSFVYRTVPAQANNPASVQLIKIASKGDPVLTGQNITLTSTADAPTGTSLLTVADTTGILIGSPASGLGISTNTVIAALTPTTLTLSTALSVDQPVGSLIIISNQTVTTTVSANQTTGQQTTLALTSTAGIVAGMTVFAFDIPTGDTVASVTPTGITLTSGSTALISAGATVYISNLNGPKSVQYPVGTNKLDTTGNPLALAARTNVYNVAMAQFDARLYASQAAADVAYVATLPTVLVTNAHALDSLRDELIEQTYLYYTPRRTLGTATFGTGNSATTQLSLGIGLDVVYYVSAAVIGNTALCSIIESSTITLISGYMSNSVISSSGIADVLSTAFGNNVDSIDVSSIDRIPNVYTVAITDTSVQPSVAYILQQKSDGTLAIAPDIKITFVLSPAGS